MKSRRGGFTLIEVVAVAAIGTLLVLILLPISRRSRNADGLAQSMGNVRALLAAQGEYAMDTGDQVAMRGTGYGQGQITGGWDTWVFAGKNCSMSWLSSSGGVFDEPAYARPLNPYLVDEAMSRPIGYVSTGAGATWSFNHGHPTSQERERVQVPQCHSPGDVPRPPTTGVSSYDDVGTSYHLNLKWWDAPGYPSAFTARYDEGVRRIRLAFQGANTEYVWIHDQIADIVVNSPTNQPVMGEFGKLDRSVCGFVDGRAEYQFILHGTLSGPGYTFLP
jgi:prepilin-type N-terminal cleavage/methylation domain-containing protein